MNGWIDRYIHTYTRRKGGGGGSIMAMVEEIDSKGDTNIQCSAVQYSSNTPVVDIPELREGEFLECGIIVIVLIQLFCNEVPTDMSVEQSDVGFL